MTIKKTISQLAEVKNRPNFIAYLALVSVCFFWGTTWVVSSYTVRQGINALQVASLRQLIAGILICGWLYFYHKGNLAYPSLKDTILLGFLNFILSNALSTWGVQFVPGGFAAIIGAAYPLWLVVIYTLYYKKSFSNKLWFGMILAFIGLIFVFYPSIKTAEVKNTFVFGFLLSLFSTVSWAIGTIYTKNQTKKDVNPYLSLGLQMLLSGSALYILLMINRQTAPIKDIPLNVWGGIMYLVVAGSLLAFVCFIYCLKYLPTEQVSIYAYINPIVALIFSSIFMDEKITPLLLFGTAVVIAGVYIINQTFKNVETSHQDNV
jgi:drug/metabolite transporter (DMT)-like permease